MAQFTSIRIEIEGKAINQFSSFSLSQQINQHHTFRLVCPAQAIDGTAGLLSQSKNLIGGKIAVQITAVETTGSLKFAGMVTQVEASRHGSHAGDVVITGYSPTILLDSSPHCKSWEKKAVKNIAQDVLKHFPSNILKPAISPVNGQTLSYTVQYKETAWAFLNRLAATYGEWFFYDGQKLVMGPPQGEKQKLFYGSNLQHFSMALQVQPANFQLMAYDYMNSEVYKATPAGIEAKAGLNDWGKHALQKSQQFYAAEPKQWHNHFLTNKKQLDDFTNTRAAAHGSNMVRFNGHSGQPGVQVGGGVSVQGRSVFSGGEEAFGDYVVTSVQHFCDGQGNYTNDFEAIPASIKIPPVAMPSGPFCETQSAFVTDNHDPKGLGRVRVKFHWMNGSEKTPWLRVTSPHGGGGKGMFFIPEKDEEVIVGFEDSSPVKPYIIGTVYHGKANNTFSNAGNDVKALQTRSGNKVIMDDAAGSVFVEDKDGNNILFDGAGNILATSKESITLSCGKSVIVMKKDGTITINGKDIITTATEKIVDGAKDIGMSADNDFVALAKKMSLTGSDQLGVSSKDLMANGSTSTKINGGKIDMDGGSQMTFGAGLIKINS